MGFVPPDVEGVPPDLDLSTLELFTRFFTIEELITDLHFLTLSARQLTMLKAALLQELARQVATTPAVRTAVRTRVQQVAGPISEASTE